MILSQGATTEQKWLSGTWRLAYAQILRVISAATGFHLHAAIHRHRPLDGNKTSYRSRLETSDSELSLMGRLVCFKGIQFCTISSLLQPGSLPTYSFPTSSRLLSWHVSQWELGSKSCGDAYVCLCVCLCVWLCVCVRVF